MGIRILVTGGTFDKEYNELDGSLNFKDTHLPELLKLGRSRLHLNVETVMMVDSLKMSDQHRRVLTHRCQAAPEKHIVITHGTDTMVDTAKYLAARITDKTIVLTGAMRPFTFGSSDGLFNLGAALAFVQTLPPGVYLAMNGKYFSPDNARKNKLRGVFEEVR